MLHGVHVYHFIAWKRISMFCFELSHIFVYRPISKSTMFGLTITFLYINTISEPLSCATIKYR